MNTYVIECRNTEAAIFTGEDAKNGDWVTNLQEKIFLEEGDTLLCRNSYIDTKAQGSGKIVMPDTPVTINFVNYSMNWNGVSRKYQNNEWVLGDDSEKLNIAYTPNTKLPNADGLPYLVCNRTQKKDDLFILNKIWTQGWEQGIVGYYEDIGGFSINIIYINNDGDQIVSPPFTIPEYQQGDNGKRYWYPPTAIYDNTKFPKILNGIGVEITLDKPIAAYVSINGKPDYELRVDGSKEVEDRRYKKTMFPYFDDSGLVSPIDQDTYTPVHNSTSFIIPAGNYDPVELCEYINTKMTESRGVPTESDFTNNPLLMNVLGFNNDPAVSQPANSEYFLPVISNDDNPEVYGYYNVAGKIRIAGASQFVLTYKDNQNKFSFQYLHTPVYSKADGTDGGDSELAGYGTSTIWSGNQENVPDPDLPKKVYNINRDGGIMFTGLAPHSFWKDQLGFDIDPYVLKNGIPTNVFNPNSIICNFVCRVSQLVTGTNYNIQAIPATIPICNITPTIGRHFTGGFNGVNQSFPKSEKFQNPYTVAGGIVPPDGTTKDYLTSIAEQTQDITATNRSVIANGTTTFGYYLLEIQSHFGNNFITPNNNFKHITAIVSKYYQKDSYTSSTAGDSLIYVHSGSPMLINSFKCRVLNPDKTLADNLGVDNTIVMEIVKAPKQPKLLKKE